MGECGEIVRDLRMTRGLTQTELARLAGVSRSTVASIESGADTLLSTAEKVLAALGAELSVGKARELPPPEVPAPDEAISSYIESLFFRESERFRNVCKVQGEQGR